MDFASLSILLYLAPPLLSLAVLSLVRRSWVLLSVPFTLAVDLLVWGKALVYNHGEFLGLTLLFLIPQLAATALLALFIFFTDPDRPSRR